MSGKTTISLGSALLLLVLLAMPWVYNGYKLTNCDFEADYKCEVIHGVGVVLPPTSWITVWFGDDSEQD